MGSVGPRTMEIIENAVQELAAMDYPRVWIGGEGITADELLWQQENEEKLPEWMQVEPGEFVGVEGTGGGLRMPEVGFNWLDGLWVIRNTPDLLPVDVVPGLGDLQQEVTCIEAAKRGGVVINTESIVRSVPEDDLTTADREFITSASFAPGGEAVAGVFEGYETRFVPLEDLTPEDVDEDLLETLQFHVTDSMGPYVIEDSDRARLALRKRLREG